MKKKAFKAESKRLLDLMINSIYTHREIFLRELISNASDAVDKLYFRSLTDKDIQLSKDELGIRVAFDKDARTVTVSDSGLGMTKDEAIAALKHGATETTSKEVNEEGNPVKTNVTVALTDEPADTRSGTPTVYLGLNEDGAVVQAGYSAATASLGYGSLSFVDAVKNEGIIEKTLQEAGVNVPAGSAQLPADKTEYSEYASDGTTLVKESYSFSGTVDLNGAAHEWSALLLYNYSTANTSGNLADTIRIVYVYVNA